MPSTAEEIFAEFPEFVGEDPTIWLALARANLEDHWGDERYEYAVACYAAFMMTEAGLGTAGSGGGTGEVASKSIGSLSISYATPAAASDASAGSGLGANKYGRMLQHLLAGVILPIRTSYPP